ncbi:type I restriction enzyme HsdR N-terminal domain-containing protein [Sediminibacterium roseum]|uniref:Type I restriction enzyme HsdR N-terminal domain-containing protein n=1 Tax=Sediminibacterium roseum TaxID=1978412 RepID=A0ABW9ZSG4_9BACT|nr:type I restriction enzyme HsdR N-terminal domain-containing protein [Sediminibacterium roseum]NCI49003.1 type I restriction enzyme HsdR N-terminal domain-containing protein [Sediminibacterium roseum]
MKAEKLYNVLEGFDFNLINNPEFQEDSVREEIVVPIIKGLGYSANKPNQIIRSRKLLHPFVSIGSKRKDIYIIPDYLFEVDGKPAWILDAKAPTEEIIKSKNVEQAYSYAIHSEVRVNFFALCNGKEFALYNIEKVEPILHCPIQALPVYWATLKKYVSPEKVFSENHFKLAKDLGLHLKRLGFESFESLIFPDVPITQIGQLDPDMFSLSGGIKIDEDRYVVTFDFGQEAFEQLIGKIPDEAIQLLSKREKGYRQAVNFGDTVYKVTIDSIIGKVLQENEDEIFLPLIITRIIR